MFFIVFAIVLPSCITLWQPGIGEVEFTAMYDAGLMAIHTS